MRLLPWRKRLPEEGADRYLHVTYELSEKRPEFYRRQPAGYSYPCPKGYGTHLVTWMPRLECREDKA
jgi:hypothetical protein